MDTLADILNEKGREVHAIRPDSSIYEAVETMAAHRVGSLLVVDHETPVGTFTERDLMIRVILEHADPSTTYVREKMTAGVICVGTDTTSDDARALMLERRCRHVVVLAGGRIVGLVSDGDIDRWTQRFREFDLRMLRDQVAIGR